MIKQIEVDQPGRGFDGLLYAALLEVGMVTLEQILLVPEDVLSVIGDMGGAHARTLRDYAKGVVLSTLGLTGTHKRPEIDLHDPRNGEPKVSVLADTGSADICDEFLNLTDSDEDDKVEVVENMESDELEDDNDETNEIW